MCVCVCMCVRVCGCVWVCVHIVMIFKQTFITYMSNRKTGHQKPNSNCAMNSLGDNPVHTAEPPDSVF